MSSVSNGVSDYSIRYNAIVLMQSINIFILHDFHIKQISYHLYHILTCTTKFRDMRTYDVIYWAELNSCNISTFSKLAVIQPILLHMFSTHMEHSSLKIIRQFSQLNEWQLTAQSREFFHYFFRTCLLPFLPLFYQEVSSKFIFEYLESTLIQYHTRTMYNTFRRFHVST